MTKDDYLLQSIADLDEVSYDEVDKILSTYEKIRGGYEFRLRKQNRLDDADAYKDIDQTLADLPQTRSTQKHRAILQQIKDSFCKGVD